MNAFESHLRQGIPETVVLSESGKSFKVEHWDKFYGKWPKEFLPTQEGWYVSYWVEGSKYYKEYEGPFESEASAGEAAHEMADAWDGELQESKPRWTPPNDEGCICSEQIVEFLKDIPSDHKWELQRWREKHGNKKVVILGHTDTSNKAFGKGVEATEEYIDDNFFALYSNWGIDGDLYRDAGGGYWSLDMIGETAREKCKCERCVEIREFEARTLETREKNKEELKKEYNKFNFNI